MEGELAKLVSFISENSLVVGITAVVAVGSLYFLTGTSKSSTSCNQYPSNYVLTYKDLALDKDEWRALELEEKEVISHDTRRFRFKFPQPHMKLGLPCGQHISFKFIEEGTGKEVIRSYTPTEEGKGYVDFVLKIYFANVHPKFPEGGKMSQYMEKMQIGDKLLMKGPKGHLEYKGRGHFVIKKRNVDNHYHVKKIGMIAGGTGPLEYHDSLISFHHLSRNHSHVADHSSYSS